MQLKIINLHPCDVGQVRKIPRFFFSADRKAPRLEVQCGQVGQDVAELKRATTTSWDVDQQLA